MATMYKNRRELKWNLRKYRHLSPKSTVEILLRHKQEKWTNYSDGSTTLDNQIISPWSSYLIQIDDFNNLEALLLSFYSSVRGLLPEDIPAMAARVAAEFDNVTTGISVVFEIEVLEEFEEGSWDEEIMELINWDAALSAEEDIDEDLGVCTMCWKDINADAAPLGKLLPCRHFFHDSCILDWISEHGHCPLCESEIVVVCRNIPL